MPVSSMLVWRCQTVIMKETEHGCPSYVLVLVHAIDLSPVTEPPSLLAGRPRRLLPRQRRDLAVEVLAEAQPVRTWREHEVSRKFLYQQVDTARDAATHAFNPEPRDEDALFSPSPGMAASGGPRIGVDWSCPVSGRCRAVPATL